MNNTSKLNQPNSLTQVSSANGANRLFNQANTKLSELKSEYVRLTHSGYLAKEDRRKVATLKDKIAAAEAFISQLADINDETVSQPIQTEQRKHDVQSIQDDNELDIFNCLTNESNE